MTEPRRTAPDSASDPAKAGGDADPRSGGVRSSREAQTSGEAFLALAEQPDPGFLREFVDFLKHNRKWWLLPILIVLGALALFAAFAGSPAAPFIYPLF